MHRLSRPRRAEHGRSTAVKSRPHSLAALPFPICYSEPSSGSRTTSTLPRLYNVDTHIDALCHVIYRAVLDNGVAADSVTAAGASELSIEVARDGVVGRGVLLDIPRLRGLLWLVLGV